MPVVKDVSNSSDSSSNSRKQYVADSSIHPMYKDIKPLNTPVKVTGDWLDRGYYSIRLKSYRPRFKNFTTEVFGIDYDIRLNLHHVPPHKIMKAFRFVIYEIFYIMRHNKYVEAGPDNVRLVLISDQLKEGHLNLKSIELNRDGADIFIEEIERTRQSHETLLLDRNLQFFFCSTKVVLPT
jgi:hypothetical protein